MELTILGKTYAGAAIALVVIAIGVAIFLVAKGYVSYVGAGGVVLGTVAVVMSAAIAGYGGLLAKSYVPTTYSDPEFEAATTL